jgi:GYF domain 2
LDWYIARAGVSYGPFTAEEFSRFQAEGHVTLTDQVWKAGFDRWIPYGDFRSTNPVHAEAPNPIIEPPGASPKKCAICLVARGLVRVPYETLGTILELMRRPTQFGRQRIDVGPRDLQRALYFYLNLFAIAFLIGASLSFLDFYGGVSQPRELANLALQIGLALPILYGLNLASRQTIRVSGLAQGVLYVDGVFIVLQVATYVGFAYLSFRSAVDRGALDIVGTEIERCLSSHSFVYWLIRGDLQFFSHQPATMAVVDVAREYVSYVLFVPFCVIFAKLMKARYEASLPLNVLFALLTFVVVSNAVPYALDQVRSSIAWKTPCIEPAMQRAYSIYSQGMVLRQIGERINAELKEKSPAGRAVSIDGDRYVMDIKLGSEEQPGHAYWHFLDVRSLYCGNTNFKLARAIEVPLKVIVRNASGEVVREEQFARSGCVP